MRWLILVASFHLAGCAMIVKPGAEPSDGVSTGKSASFDARHEFELEVPSGAQQVRAWLPIPSPNDQYQSVSQWRVECPVEARVVEDTWGNSFLYVVADAPATGSMKIVTTFRVTRLEANADLTTAKTRPHTQSEQEALAAWLEQNSMSVIDDDIKSFAADAVGMEPNPIVTARLLYDAVIAYVERIEKDPNANSAVTMAASGTGSSQRCFSSRSGDAADFNSLYAACARSIGLPVRTVFGSLLNGSLSGKDRDLGDHSWIEFNTPNQGWIPLDAAIADLYDAFEPTEHNRHRVALSVATEYNGPDAAKIEYYFGNLEQRRVSWHWGRALELGQRGDPLQWNTRGYAEIDGSPVPVQRKLTFTDVE